MLYNIGTVNNNYIHIVLLQKRQLEKYIMFIRKITLYKYLNTLLYVGIRNNTYVNELGISINYKVYNKLRTIYYTVILRYTYIIYLSYVYFIQSYIGTKHVYYFKSTQFDHGIYIQDTIS